MAGFNASWVHGSALVMETPPVDDGAVSAINHFGWGTQITMRPGDSRWFHIAIPTPVILNGVRMKLLRVFLQWQQIRGFPNSSSISDAHLWDGQTRIAKLSSHDFKENNFAVLAGHSTYELFTPKVWQFGLGLSVRLHAEGNVGGHFLEGSESPVVVIGSAGADFEA
jgi:hypothetical protein